MFRHALLLTSSLALAGVAMGQAASTDTDEEYKLDTITVEGSLATSVVLCVCAHTTRAPYP